MKKSIVALSVIAVVLASSFVFSGPLIVHAVAILIRDSNSTNWSG